MIHVPARPAPTRAVFLLMLLAASTARPEPALQFMGLSESNHASGRTSTSLTYDVHLDTLKFATSGRSALQVVTVTYLRESSGPVDERPVMFFFPGGPGLSVSHLALAFGPRSVNIRSDLAPGATGELSGNAGTLLDETDLVFIDMPGAGFSRTDPGADKRAFYGIRQDAELQATVVRSWLASHKRDRSPVFVTGHSYGALRATYTAIAVASQSPDVPLQGLVLLCGAWDLSAMDFAGGFTAEGDLSAYWSAIPTYAAVAWHHGRVRRTGTLEQFAGAARRFAVDRYAPALIRGAAQLSAHERAVLASEISQFVGLPPDTIAEHALRIDPALFRSNLIPGRTLGLDNAALSADSDPISGHGNVPLDAAWRSYLLDLGLRDANEYRPGSFAPAAEWDWKVSDTSKMGYPKITEALLPLLKLSPSLRIFVAAGYYDLATPYFMIEQAAGRIDAAPGQVTLNIYQSGHSLWIDTASRIALNNDLRAFVAQ